MNQTPTEDKSNPYKESITRYKGGLDESSPYNNGSYGGLTPSVMTPSVMLYTNKVRGFDGKGAGFILKGRAFKRIESLDRERNHIGHAQLNPQE